jgi:hypothetical protein
MYTRLLKSIGVVCFFLLTECLFAQTTFTVTPNPTYNDTLSNYEAHVVVKNITTLPEVIRWTKQAVFIEPDSLCYFILDDPYAHYPPQITTKVFWIDPGEELELGIEISNPDGSDCCAIIELLLNNIDFPADTVTVVYFLNQCQPTPVNEAGKPEVRSYPNPVHDILYLENASAVQAVRIYNIKGKLAAYFKANTNHQYNLSSLPSGSYFAVLEDEHNRYFQVFKITKQ